jgi:hypothetical protein
MEIRDAVAAHVALDDCRAASGMGADEREAIIGDQLALMSVKQGTVALLHRGVDPNEADLTRPMAPGSKALPLVCTIVAGIDRHQI